jgi:two-component sensor histidine kinase
MIDVATTYRDTNSQLLALKSDDAFRSTIKMLNTQANQISDKKLRRKFKEAQLRIETMAIVHDKLYETDISSEISLLNYLTVLFNTVANSYSPNTKVVLQAIMDKAYLNMDQAIHCGLILNEVFINLFEHAFIDEKEGDALLILSKNEDDIYISVTHNGCDFDSTTSDGALDISLISLLTEQLGGNSEITTTETGTSFSLSFTKN